MASTTPNKEIVRRICLLSGASQCYLLVSPGDEYVDVLADIKTNEIKNCISELESWCGMKFRLYSLYDETEYLKELKKQAEKILPITL